MFEIPRDTIRCLLERPSETVDWRSILDTVTTDSPADLESLAALLHACRADRGAFDSVIARAAELRTRVFGSAVKLFVPLYLSNDCVNDCLYCAYRRDNPEMPRRTLDEEDFKREIVEVTGMGYRVLEIVTSESPALKKTGVLARYVAIVREMVDTCPQAKEPSEIILMSWALSEKEFALVRDAGVDSFYLWQETYDPERYAAAHPAGTPKSDFEWRLGVFDRALSSGIQRVGIGVLFGLAPWEFDLLALISHGHYLQRTYGAAVDALGLPRFKLADGAPLQKAPCPVSDDELRLAVALYRLAFPRSHVFLNTREKLSLLLDLLAGGGSEMNIACQIFPGGYTQPARERQFEHYSYPTDKTLALLAERGYHPTHFAVPEPSLT